MTGYSITHHYLLYPLYGSETWTVEARDARRITAAEMKYMKKDSRIHLDKLQTNAQIGKELKKHLFWTNYWNTRETGHNM